MQLNRLAFVLVASAIIFGSQQSLADESASRHFQLQYATTLTNIENAKQIRLWLPIPTSNAAQDVTVLQTSFVGIPKDTTEKKYGNRMLYFDVPTSAPQKTFKIEYEIVRREVRSELDNTEQHSKKAESKDSASSLANLDVFLVANAQVPITGKPLTLLPKFRETSTLARAKEIYNQVDALVKYDKSKPGYGNGDVVWVCDSRTGNCTDFHSLFISMARSQSIPAKFEIGFPLPADKPEGKIGGYHCWASFLANKNWIPVDISEADKHPEMKEYYFGNLTKDRVSFSTGRDIVLNPPQDGPPLNYFVYPYVEVDGKPLPKKNIQLDFSFRDAD